MKRNVLYSRQNKPNIILTLFSHFFCQLHNRTKSHNTVRGWNAHWESNHRLLVELQNTYSCVFTNPEYPNVCNYMYRCIAVDLCRCIIIWKRKENHAGFLNCNWRGGRKMLPLLYQPSKSKVNVKLCQV